MKKFNEITFEKEMEDCALDFEMMVYQFTTYYFAKWVKGSVKICLQKF